MRERYIGSVCVCVCVCVRERESYYLDTLRIVLGYDLVIECMHNGRTAGRTSWHLFNSIISHVP